MPRTIAQLKRRLEQALADADHAEAVLQLVRDAVRRYGFEPSDVFDHAQEQATLRGGKASKSVKRKPARAAAAYSDAAGNTWAGRGRRPAWLNDALARGASLEDFRKRR